MAGIEEIVQACEPQTAESDVIQEALVAIRRHLGMEIAYFSEFVDGRAVFRRVDAPGLEHLIKVGDSHSLQDVYCNHILEGRLPELIPDTSQEPLAATMPITTAALIGSHASIPIRLPDGRPFGMFCCLSPRANLTLNARDLDVMRVFAGLATRQLHSDLEQGRTFRDKQAAVETVLRDTAFEILYQPILNLARMETVSLEALCRFRPEPYRPPDLWFRQASEIGLGTELELGAIRAAVRAFPDVPGTISLSLNASPATIVSGRLEDALDPRYLRRTVIEVTEHAPVGDYRVLHDALAPLRARGVRVAVDDAGAGYSGLQHIVQMEPDIIKMDMSLTRGIHEDRARRALASAMIFYAHETGSIIVAEGVETIDEMLTLKALGVTAGQGYLFGRPQRLEPAPLRGARTA